MAKKPSRYEGFAALNSHGHLLWGTISRTEQDAQDKHDRFNPDPTGGGAGEKIGALQITLTKGKRL